MVWTAGDIGALSAERAQGLGQRGDDFLGLKCASNGGAGFIEDQIGIEGVTAACGADAGVVNVQAELVEQGGGTLEQGVVGARVDEEFGAAARVAVTQLNQRHVLIGVADDAAGMPDIILWRMTQEIIVIQIAPDDLNVGNLYAGIQQLARSVRVASMNSSCMNGLSAPRRRAVRVAL
ncbi:MAG: hypothetical protein MZV65_16820 [Chromatiales bacterium]|nr:hypothetical protein [Chromatiales bacterium]